MPRDGQHLLLAEAGVVCWVSASSACVCLLVFLTNYPEILNWMDGCVAVCSGFGFSVIQLFRDTLTVNDARVSKIAFRCVS